MVQLQCDCISKWMKRCIFNEDTQPNVIWNALFLIRNWAYPAVSIQSQRIVRNNVCSVWHDGISQMTPKGTKHSLCVAIKLLSGCRSRHSLFTYGNFLGNFGVYVLVGRCWLLFSLDWILVPWLHHYANGPICLYLSWFLSLSTVHRSVAKFRNYFKSIFVSLPDAFFVTFGWKLLSQERLMRAYN